MKVGFVDPMLLSAGAGAASNFFGSCMGQCWTKYPPYFGSDENKRRYTQDIRNACIANCQAAPGGPGGPPPGDTIFGMDKQTALLVGLGLAAVVMISRS